MDISSLLLTLGVIAYFNITIYIANADDVQARPFTRSKWLLYGAVGMMFAFGLILAQYALLTLVEIDPTLTQDTVLPDVDGTAAVLIFGLCSLASFGCVRLIGVPSSRSAIKRLCGRYGVFNPESTVHITAVVLSVVLLCVNLGQLVLNGGLEGLAESYEQGVSFVSNAFFQQLIWLSASFLGIGLFIHRDRERAFARLGLRFPTADDLFAGIGVGLLMVIFVFVLSFAWTLITPPETIENQQAASRQIANALNTIPLALIVSLMVATGEEIFFRGALQPVFGIGLTSVFFALLHIQYTLTPAALAVFVLALALGWLRKRHSTTSAIIAHFIYNFTQLALAILAASFLGGGA